jgi:hypothetical protein
MPKHSWFQLSYLLIISLLLPGISHAYAAGSLSKQPKQRQAHVKKIMPCLTRGAFAGGGG